MEPKLVEFKTKDKLVLPGLLYEAKDSDVAAIYLHGNGSSSVFYDEVKSRHLPNLLNESSISLLKFNNRGAHIIKKLNIDSDNVKKERKLFGCAYELIKDCVLDIDAAINFLKQSGYKKFYLIGKSTGANKICVYHHYKPNNEILKYILICGGDDTGIYHNLLGNKIFSNLLKKSIQKIKSGDGDSLIPELVQTGEIFSYKGFYDIANPDGDYNCFPFGEFLGKSKMSTKPLFRYFKEINKKSLVVYGEMDEFAWGEVPKLVRELSNINPSLNYEIIKDADHSFNGKEIQLSKLVSDWLSQK